MGVPQTLPANFGGWDKAKAAPQSGPPPTLPANFSQWDAPKTSYKDAYGTPSSEIEGLLKSNPSYQFLGPDPRFPNRQPGVYPVGPGNEWRNDPDLNARKGNPDQWPVDPHVIKHAYQSGKQAVAMGAAPLAFEATVPQLIGGLVGGGVGSFGGQKIAQAAGAGETGQEVAGDVGGLIGGVAGGASADWSAAQIAKVKSVYDNLPSELKQEFMGMLSPTMKSRLASYQNLRTGIQKLNAPSAEVTQASSLLRGPQPVIDPAAGLGNIPVSKTPGSAGSMVESVTRPSNLSDLKTGTMPKPAQVLNEAQKAVGYEPPKPGQPIAQRPAGGQTETLPPGHTPVESEAVKSFKYDPATQQLEIHPTSGSTTYRYGDVSQDQADQFQNAESKGRAWQDIRNSSSPLVEKRIGGKWQLVKPARTEENTQSLADLGQKSLDAMTIKHPEYGDIPRFVYRARDVGEEGIPANQGHAQAGSSLQQIQKYAEPGQRSEEGNEVISVDLKKLKSSDYVVKSHPDGSKWVQFNRPLGENEVKVVSGQSASAK